MQQQQQTKQHVQIQIENNNLQQQRVSQDRQRQNIEQQQQRLNQYNQHLADEQRAADQRAQQLRKSNRNAQFTFQMQYSERLRLQHEQYQNDRNYNYNDDPYYYTAPSYRFNRGGRYFEPNEYGARLLRQAINFGYDEGFRSGQADRHDHWRSDYRNSYAYQDANFGYDGFYVERDDYNYYFRQGFQRGYEDGYYRRNRYGTEVDGSFRIGNNFEIQILGLSPIH